MTIVSGKNRRLTFVECLNTLDAMLDIGKSADLVLLMIDGSFGFEMETFEFLNILQAHGFPKILGVLTHLDHFKDNKKLRSPPTPLHQTPHSAKTKGDAAGAPVDFCISAHMPPAAERNLCARWGRRTKKRMKARFWTEVHDGAKLFYLSGLEKTGR